MNPSLVPDLPIQIGYKCCWFAVRDMDVRELATIFSIGEISPCNWQFGMPAARAGSVFISPAVQGWRIIIGNLLPFADSKSIETVKVLLKHCSREAGEAQYFATHRVVEAHCWMKAEDGVIVRAFGFVGDRMEIDIDEGRKTPVEPPDLISSKEVTLFASDEDADVEVSFPDESLVMAIAADWSLDPNNFSKADAEPGLGVIGAAPERFT